VFTHKVAAITVVALIVFLPRAARSDPVVVYDNTAYGTDGNFTSVGLPDGFWPFNIFNANEPMGDQITLAGSERIITEFDLILSSSQSTTLASLTFSIRPFDSNTFTPGDANWTTTLTNVPVDGNTTVKITVPNVEVSDTIVWLAAADSNTAGLATFDPPTVGSSGNWYWDLDPTYGWFPLVFYDFDPADSSPIANFGAKVWAIPEPTVTAVLAVGGLLLTLRRRRGGRPAS